MKSYLFHFIIIIQVLLMQLCTCVLFLTSKYRGCIYKQTTNQLSNCSGTIDDPIDYFFLAVDQGIASGSSTFTFIPDGTYYIHYYEYIPGTSNFVPNRTGLSTFDNIVTKKSGTLNLAPLFCGDSQIKKSKNPSLIPCLTRNDRLTIYLKTNLVGLELAGNFIMNNIILDGSEDLYFINLYHNPSRDLSSKYDDQDFSSNFKNCLYTRIRCCENPINSRSSLYPDINCSINTNFAIPTPTYDIFGFSLLINGYIALENCTLQNYYGRLTRNFFYINKVGAFGGFQLKVTNSNFLNNFLTNALFAEAPDYLAYTIYFSFTKVIFSNNFPNSNKYFSIFPGGGDQMLSNYLYYTDNVRKSKTYIFSNCVIYTNNVYPLMKIVRPTKFTLENVTIIGTNNTASLKSYNIQEDQILSYINDYIIDGQNYFQYMIPPFSGIYIQYDQVPNTLNITSVNMTNVNTILGGIIFESINPIKASENTYIMINNSVFQNNLAFGGSCIRFISKTDDKLSQGIIIQNSSFNNNKARVLNQNMILYQYYAYHYIINSKNALIISGYGGAVFVNYKKNVDDFSKDNIKIMKVNSSNFTNNYAELGGGSIFSDLYPVNINISNVLFNNNIATYGPNVASVAIHIQFFIDSIEQVFEPNLNWTFIIENLKNISNTSSISLRSGELENDLFFVLYDIYGQIVNTDNLSTLGIGPKERNPQDKYFFTIPFSLQAHQGIFAFTNKSTIKYATGKNFSVIVMSDGINRPYGIDLPNTTLSELVLSFRLCKLGEIYLDDACKKCKQDTYSLSFDPYWPGPCQPCDLQTSICPGGSKIYPLPGYWIKNETADMIFACPSTDACIGFSSEDVAMKSLNINICKTGYESNLCNICSKGYGKYGSNNQCVQCNSNISYYVWLCGMIIVQMVLLLLTIIPSIKDSDNAQQDDLSLREGTYMKILMNFTQLSSLIKSATFSMPTISTNLFSIFGAVSLSLYQVFSIDCLVNTSSKNAFFMKAIYIVIIPLTLMAITGICAILPFNFFRKNRDKLFIIELILTIYYQQNLLQVAFSFYECINLYRLDQPEYYLVKSPNIQCWTSEYWTWVLCISLPIIIIWGVALPLLFGYIIFSNRKNPMNLRKKYSFLVMGYRTNSATTLIWESYYMIRRLMMIMINIFILNLSIQISLIIELMVIIFSIILQYKISPYDNFGSNKIELWGLIASYMNYSVVIYFTSNQKSQTFEIILALISILLSGFVIAIWFILYLRVKILKLKNIKIRRFLLKFIGDPENLEQSQSLKESKSIQIEDMNSNTEFINNPKFENYKITKTHTDNSNQNDQSKAYTNNSTLGYSQIKVYPISPMDSSEPTKYN